LMNMMVLKVYELLPIWCWSLSIGHNVLRLGEGCLTESSKFAQCFWQLLPNRCYVLGGLSVLNLI